MLHKMILVVFIALAIMILVFCFMEASYGANYNVQSNTGNNNQGYIFVSTGQKQGGTEIGTWQDPIFLKGEEGDVDAIRVIQKL